MLLNPDYHGGQVTFRPRSEKNTSYQGAHYVEQEGKLFIFSEFRLNALKLDAHTQAQIKKVIGNAADFGTHRDLIMSVLALIQQPPKDLIQVSNAVLKITPDGEGASMEGDPAYVPLDRADYSAPILVKTNDTVLLDVQF